MLSAFCKTRLSLSYIYVCVCFAFDLSGRWIFVLDFSSQHILACLSSGIYLRIFGSAGLGTLVLMSVSICLGFIKSTSLT